MVNPKSIQPKKTAQLFTGISIIRYMQHKTPKIGIKDHDFNELYIVIIIKMITKTKNKYS
jgi:hypothetical protein